MNFENTLIEILSLNNTISTLVINEKIAIKKNKILFEICQRLKINEISLDVNILDKIKTKYNFQEYDNNLIYQGLLIAFYKTNSIEINEKKDFITSFLLIQTLLINNFYNQNITYQPLSKEINFPILSKYHQEIGITGNVLSLQSLQNIFFNFFINSENVISIINPEKIFDFTKEQKEKIKIVEKIYLSLV